MSRNTDPSHLDAVIRVDNLPLEGRVIRVVADEAQRTALAERLMISAVENLSAELRAVKFRGGLQVSGVLKATIVQPCIVSFEPVTQVIEEPVERIFLPVAGQPKQNGDEIFVDVEGEDEPDYFEGPEADLSELIVETLSLAIDPYPRAPDAELDEAADDEEGATERPFAALKALKGDDDGGD